MTVIQTVGVIGAGQMGGGIAQVSAATGFNVKVYDAFENARETCKGVMTQSLQKFAENGKLTGSVEDVLARISFENDMSSLSEADIVIEAAPENLDLKHKLFTALTPHLNSRALIASNTSSISIARLATFTDRPERFMGMHFFNPVPLMPLVELIRGVATHEDTVTSIRGLSKALGKDCIIAEDQPGFAVNRVLCPMINEAIQVVYEGISTVEDMDKAMKLGTNHPMGPLTLADFIGLDTILSVLDVLYTGFRDSKFRASPLLVKYVEAGWLGRKTGRGFYDYSGDKPVPTHS